MRSSKYIIVLLVVIFAMGIPETKAMAWGHNDHKASVERNINTKSKEVNFNSEELELLYKAVMIADANDYRKLDGIYVGGLHGKGNYVANLKYVYELAFKYLMKQSNVDDESFINNYFNECTYFTESDMKDIAAVNTSILKLVNSKILYYTSGEHELSNREKAIKIFGFACHLAGDIYAHNTYVPSSAVFYNEYNSALNFNERDFVSTPRYSSLDKWSNLKLIISKYNIPFVDLNNLNTVSVVTENGSIVKLKTLYDENLLDSISSNLKANLFEDNSKFHKTRFDATMAVIKEMVSKFNAALYAEKNKQQFHGIFHKDILNYYSNYNDTDYELRNFNFYYSSID